MKKNFVVYLVKFIGIFLFLYLGSVVAYGAGYPGGILDSPFIHKYFYYQQTLREVYLSITAHVFDWMDISTIRKGATGLYTQMGGISINDACLGFGVFSFWIAFTLADNTPWKKKLSWLMIGLAVLFVLNELRMIVILAVMHYKWANLYNIDHHLVFNIICYIAIFTMIWLYSRKNINTEKENSKNKKIPAMQVNA